MQFLYHTIYYIAQGFNFKMVILIYNYIVLTVFNRMCNIFQPQLSKFLHSVLGELAVIDKL